MPEKNIAEVSTTTGAPVSSFKHSASAMVETVLAANNHIIVGGLGADDELLTNAGLWIASDNQQGSQMCGNVQNLSGICFLPCTS